MIGVPSVPPAQPYVPRTHHHYQPSRVPGQNRKTTTMRLIIRDCSNTRDHALHVSDPRRSMYSCVDGLERFVCPGGRLGDRTLREADSLDDVVRAYDEEQGQTLLVALAESTGQPIDRRPAPCRSYEQDDDEPDYEAILEERAEARAEEAIERAERDYERYVYGD